MTNNYATKIISKSKEPKPQTIQTILNFSKAYQVINSKQMVVEIMMN